MCRKRIGGGAAMYPMVRAHRFMPGMRVARAGVVRQCQWRAIADWTATGADGAPRGAGTNVFEFDADGRVTAVTGFWA